MGYDQPCILLLVNEAHVLRQLIYCGIYSYKSRVLLLMLKRQLGAQIPNILKAHHIWPTSWLIKSSDRPGIQEWIAHPKCSARLSKV